MLDRTSDSAICANSFFVVGLKLDVVAILLKYYERTGNAPNEDKINFIIWGLIFLLLLCAYGLPL